MNKKTLIIILIIDVLVMIGAGGYIVMQLGSRQNINAIIRSRPAVQQQAGVRASAQQRSATSAVGKPASVAMKQSAAARRILFTYRNSKPAAVSVSGDFTNWKAVPMTKGANHVWSVSLPLEPGDFCYGYQVDGRFILDPNNPRSVKNDRGIRCSFLLVKPK